MSARIGEGRWDSICHDVRAINLDTLLPRFAEVYVVGRGRPDPSWEIPCMVRAGWIHPTITLL